MLHVIATYLEGTEVQNSCDVSDFVGNGSNDTQCNGNIKYHFPIQIQLRLDSIIFRDQIELWLDYKMKIGGKLGETKLLSSETKYLCFYSNTLLPRLLV